MKGGKNASYPNPRPGADVHLWALVFGHECAAIMGDGLVFGAGGREREYQWLWKQSPAVRRTLVNVRGVIAVMEVARDLFSSNQKYSFFIVQASNMRHTTCIYGNCFHAEVPPGYQSVHTLQTTVLMACLSQFTSFYISIGE